MIRVVMLLFIQVGVANSSNNFNFMKKRKEDVPQTERKLRQPTGEKNFFEKLPTVTVTPPNRDNNKKQKTKKEQNSRSTILKIL